MTSKVFQTMVERSMEAILLLDSSATVLYASPAIERVFGYTPEEACGLSAIDWIHPNDGSTMLNLFAACQRRPGQVIQLSGLYHHHRDNEVLYGEGSLINHLDDAEVGAVLFYFREMPADSQIAKDWGRQHALLHTLINALPHQIYVKDVEGRFVTANEAARAARGRRAARIEGKTDFYFLPHDLAADLRRDEQQVIQSGRPLVNREVLMARRDGQRQWLSVTLVPIRDPEGITVGLVGLSYDVTRRRLVEEELRHAKDAAEAANRAKDEFLANVSHEIRTPMNAILGMTELVLAAELSEDQRQCLTTVKSATDNLLGIINDLLDFAKIEAGKLDLEEIPFSCRDTFADALQPLGLRAHQKGLELLCDIAADVPDALVGDPGRLRQVVVNLVSNAIKFTEKGEVFVLVRRETTEHTEHTEKKQPTENQERTENEPQGPSSASSSVSVYSVVTLHFEVRDTGIGIPADKLRDIFEPFTQADSSMTRRYGGTGLGLTISSRLLVLMGGRLWVESTIGQGSTFHGTACFAVSPALESIPERALHGLPVLVVDGRALGRNILVQMLRGWGMRPVAVGRGQQALDSLERAGKQGEPFALALVDVHLADTDGLSLAAQIRARPELSSLPVLLLSPSRPEDGLRCRELGIAAHLIKPVKPSALQEAIAQVLGLSQPPARQPSPASSAAGNPLAPGLKVLLAEDNTVNQSVAVRMLQRRGHTVVVASDGREALEAWEREAFDLVLMDVQMPEMDGLEAARAIRKREQGSGRFTPIIALTAHAMKGDRERVLAAGMDGHVSKPLQAKELFRTVDEVLASTVRARPAEAVFDEAEALARLDGDEEGLRLAAQKLLARSGPDRDAFDTTVAGDDYPAIARLAHKLKGQLGLFSRRAGRAAAELEEAARRQDTPRLEACAQLLAQQMQQLHQALQVWLDRAPSEPGG